MRWERQGSPARGEEETGLQLGEERVRGRQAGREARPPRSTGRRPRGRAWRRPRPRTPCPRILGRRQLQSHSLLSPNPSCSDDAFEVFVHSLYINSHLALIVNLARLLGSSSSLRLAWRLNGDEPDSWLNPLKLACRTYIRSEARGRAIALGFWIGALGAGTALSAGLKPCGSANLSDILPCLKDPNLKKR